METVRQPESVLVVVHTADRRVLLMERRNSPGFWQSVTGSLERGETLPEAARREFAEETGLSGELTDLGRSREFGVLPAFRHRFPPGVTRNLEHAFALELPHARRIRINAAEHRGYRCLPWRKAAALTASWTNREAIEALFGERPA